jgi:hypothetical protein
VPWTGEMEENCGAGLRVRLRGWNSAMAEEEKGKEKEEINVGEGMDGSRSSRNSKRKTRE